MNAKVAYMLALVLVAVTSPALAQSCMVDVTQHELVTERFGINADLRKGRTHDGLDFRAPLGTPLYAGADGVVATRDTWRGAGNVLVIRRPNGETMTYYHMSSFGPGTEVGKEVKAGQMIGLAGGTSAKSTGSAAYASYAPHLHFIYGVPSAGQARQTNFSQHASRLRSVNPGQLPHRFNGQARAQQAGIGFKTDPAPFFCKAYPFKDKSLDAILGGDTKQQHQIVFGNVPPGGSPPDGAMAPVDAAAGNAQLILAQHAGQPIEEFLSDSDGFGALPGPPVGAYETLSVNEMLATEAARRFQSADWNNELTKVSSRALYVDFVRAQGVSNYMSEAVYRKKQRVEALLAVLTSQRLAHVRGDTDRARERALKGDAQRSIQ
ncbi:sugar ABC transporter permease [Xanthomonas citri pv. fuscans]|nr:MULTISPECIES: M23 family metallopeptidase [Xanthomonas]KGT53989.1 sugar ABC transporter permease [Xanthomonas citri pv. fuscans]